MGEKQDVERAMDRLLSAAGLSRSSTAAPGAVRVRSVWSDQAGVRIHHLEAGSGSPVVLLHGGTGGGANWFRMIGPLSDRFRVLAPDLPGFGLSDPIDVVTPLPDPRRQLGPRVLLVAVGFGTLLGVTAGGAAGPLPRKSASIFRRRASHSSAAYNAFAWLYQASRLFGCDSVTRPNASAARMYSFALKSDTPMLKSCDGLTSGVERSSA